MKLLFASIVVAVLLVGCGKPQQSSPPADTKLAEADRALLDAANAGNIATVKQHLTAGANVNAKDKEGQTPLHMAETKEVAELLVANGADVNAKGRGGQTPLHYAAFGGHKEIAELLLDKGADVNAKEGKGNTPLDAATFEKQTEIADLLRKHGGKTKWELKAAGN